MKIPAITSACLVLVAAQAQAAHIVTQTRQGDVLIGQTHTYANAAGDLRIDERRIVSSATSSAAGNGEVTVTYEPGRIDDTMIYQSRGQAIVSLEGDICRTLRADSKPPAVLGPMAGQMAQVNEQMAAAMKQANAALEKAMKDARAEGMTPEQERAMRQFTQPFMEAPQATTDRAYTVRALGQTVKVGRYTGQGYEVSDADGRPVQRLWMVPTSKLRGSAHVRKAMEGMMATYESFLDQMGAGGLMDDSMMAVFTTDELAGKYPVRIEDLEHNEITDIVEVEAAGEGEFYPTCEERDMLGM